MGKNTQWNKIQVAENYDFGRPLDEKIVVELFHTIKHNASYLSHITFLLDAGCGTGRITIPLAKHFQDIHIVGIDSSEEMLAVLRHKISGFGIKNYDVLSGNILKLPTEDNYFDAILLSSVLHGIEDWKIVVDELIRVIKPHGYLLLLSEQSDMYDIGLGRVKSRKKNLLELFWGKYIELRVLHALDDPETSQVGIKWQLGYPEVIRYLKEKHYISANKDVVIHWEKELIIGDLMKIITHRCWSSMFTADNDKYEALIHDMHKWLKEQNFSFDTLCSFSNILKCEIIEIAK